MRKHNVFASIITVILLIFVHACSRQAMPEVNEENCKTAKVSEIKDKRMQEEFLSLCVRRGTFKHSPVKKW